MLHEQDEFTVNLEDITPKPEIVKRLPAKLRLWQALVSHFIAIILVLALILSILLHAFLLWKIPGEKESIGTAFEKWYAVISPFAGLALGAYYGATKIRQ